jgi:hypothetical protein
MRLLKLFVATILVLTCNVALAEKPDPVDNPPLQVREANTDPANGDAIRVHEVGTASVNVVGGSIDANISGGQVEIVNELSDPVPVTVQNDGFLVDISSVYQFLGYAENTKGANIGVVEMHKVCQDAYANDEARMCTSKEFWTSPNIESPVGSAAWIQPSIVATYVLSTELFPRFADFSGGYFKLTHANCLQWSSAATNVNIQGACIIEGLGAVTYCGCDQDLMVTCCAPVGH